MKSLYLFIFTLIILSCGNNTDESKTKATIDSAFKNIDSIAKGPQLTQIKPLPAQSGFTVSLIDEETYTKAVNRGIKIVSDTSDFKKIGNRLELYNNSKKVYEFIDSSYLPLERGVQDTADTNVFDNVEFDGYGYCIIQNKKWFLGYAGAYEEGYYFLVPPPYNIIYKVTSKITFNPSGNYFFDLFFSPLGDTRASWSLYSSTNNNIKKITSYNFDCWYENKAVSNQSQDILCPMIEDEIKWISDKELLLKVTNYEENYKTKAGYLKITIK